MGTIIIYRLDEKPSLVGMTIMLNKEKVGTLYDGEKLELKAPEGENTLKAIIRDIAQSEDFNFSIHNLETLVFDIEFNFTQPGRYDGANFMTGSSIDSLAEFLILLFLSLLTLSIFWLFTRPWDIKPNIEIRVNNKNKNLQIKKINSF